MEISTAMGRKIRFHPALEKLKNTAVFHANLEELWNALILGKKRISAVLPQKLEIRRCTSYDISSKGLEFPVVFVSGIKSGKLPLESTKHPADIQEERRLFYVGMTRAREELVLTYGAEPSPFISELPDIIKENY